MDVKDGSSWSTSFQLQVSEGEFLQCLLSPESGRGGYENHKVSAEVRLIVPYDGKKKIFDIANVLFQEIEKLKGSKIKRLDSKLKKAIMDTKPTTIQLIKQDGKPYIEKQFIPDWAKKIAKLV